MEDQEEQPKIAEEVQDERKSVRPRKTVERFPVEAPIKPKTATEEVIGSGDALSDNQHIMKALDKMKSDDEALKRLHMILYGSTGTSALRKRGIRKWTGVDDESKRAAITAKIEATKSSTVLKGICTLLGLSKGKNLEALKTAVAEYLFKPIKETKRVIESRSAKKPRTESFTDFLARRAPEVTKDGGLPPAQVTAVLTVEWKQTHAKPAESSSSSSSSSSSTSSDSE